MPTSNDTSFQYHRARNPNIESTVAAGTSILTPACHVVSNQIKCETDVGLTWRSITVRYRSSFTASASNAAWKKETVKSQRSHHAIESRFTNRPAKSRLTKPLYQRYARFSSSNAHLKSMTSVPTRLATPISSKAIASMRQTLAAVRLKSTWGGFSITKQQRVIKTMH